MTNITRRRQERRAPMAGALPATLAAIVLVSTLPAPAPAAEALAADSGIRLLEPISQELGAAGWELLALDPTTPTKWAWFASKADLSTFGSFLTVLVHEERSAPAATQGPSGQFFYLSSLDRWALDCRGSRGAIISILYYGGNRLTGSTTSTSTDPNALDWFNIESGTTGSSILKWACDHVAAPDEAGAAPSPPTGAPSSAPSARAPYEAAVATATGDGWIPVGESDLATAMVRYDEMKRSGSRVVLWIHWEYRTPFEGGDAVPNYLSEMEHDEIDCSTREDRTLDRTVYAANGVRGAAASFKPPAPKWSARPPGSVGRGVIDRVCAATTTTPDKAPGTRPLLNET